MENNRELIAAKMVELLDVKTGVRVEKDAIEAHRLLMQLFHHFNKYLFATLPLPTDELILTIESKGERMSGCFEVGHFTSPEKIEEYKSSVLDYAARKAEHKQKQDDKVERFGGKRSRFKDENAEKAINSLRIPRIVMNALYNARDLREVCGTLVHEMVHFWQWKWGARYPKSATHNQEWADKMVELGLTPVCTDKKAKPGQKTGRNCTHEIVDGGRFDKAFELLPDSIKMPWAALKFSAGSKRKCKKKNYACGCGKTFQTTKKIVEVMCRSCNQDFIRVLSEDEEIDEEEALEIEKEREEAKRRSREHFEKSNPNNWGAGERGENPDLDDLFGL